MSDKDAIFLSAAVAAVLADGLTADQSNTLGNFIMCIGEDLIAAAVQKDVRYKRAQELIESKDTAAQYYES